MGKILSSKGMEIKLERTTVCELTGRIMEAGEVIIVSPKFKRVIIAPVVTPQRTFFIFLTIVPFRPKADVDLYRREKKAMGLLTNVKIF